MNEIIMIVKIFYYLTLVFITIPSWGFVDANMPLPKIASLAPIIFFQTIYPTAWYIASVVILFVFYIWVLYYIRKKALTSRHIWYLIFATAVILFWTFPALSNDIFNYIATAKVAFIWKENPYIVMPIEIPKEPMLAFLHAANKVALYGPVWLLLTAIPLFLGMGNLLTTLFTFKLFMTVWYLGLCYLIWIASERKPWPLAFFALNPLVTLSTLVDGHNDVVMMALALGGFLMVKRKKFVYGIFIFIFSIFIKGATLFLVPVFIWCLYRQYKKEQISWQGVWHWASVAMYLIFLLSPIREEIYAWYFIWPLTFLALVDKPNILRAASYGFSVGLLLRIVPFFYTRSWSGITPTVKRIVTFVPPFISSFIYGKTLRR